MGPFKLSAAGYGKSFLMLISRSANKLKIAGKEKNMDGCNSQPESALFARTNNDYFEQIDQGYSARRRRGDR